MPKFTEAFPLNTNCSTAQCLELQIHLHCNPNCNLAPSLRVMASHRTSVLGLLAPLTLMLALVGVPASVFADSGEATYYSPPFPLTACYGSDTSEYPAGNLIAAASPDLYQGGAACGVSYQVTCTGATSGAANGCSDTPTVTVKVVDLCPGCSQPGFDLSPDAFQIISNLDVGIINIEFNRV